MRSTKPMIMSWLRTSRTLCHRQCWWMLLAESSIPTVTGISCSIFPTLSYSILRYSSAITLPITLRELARIHLEIFVYRQFLLSRASFRSLVPVNLVTRIEIRLPILTVLWLLEFHLSNPILLCRVNSVNLCLYLDSSFAWLTSVDSLVFHAVIEVGRASLPIPAHFVRIDLFIRP